MIITKQQLEGLLDYYEMYGVDEMKFDKDKIEEALNLFGPSIKGEFHPEHKTHGFGMCCGSVPEFKIRWSTDKNGA